MEIRAWGGGIVADEVLLVDLAKSDSAAQFCCRCMARS